MIALCCSPADFNPRSLTGATQPLKVIWLHMVYFNPRSLTGATSARYVAKYSLKFQSTLPYGSDSLTTKLVFFPHNFNPRSLTGATA